MGSQPRSGGSAAPWGLALIGTAAVLLLALPASAAHGGDNARSSTDQVYFSHSPPTMAERAQEGGTPALAGERGEPPLNDDDATHGSSSSGGSSASSSASGSSDDDGGLVRYEDLVPVYLISGTLSVIGTLTLAYVYLQIPRAKISHPDRLILIVTVCDLALTVSLLRCRVPCSSLRLTTRAVHHRSSSSGLARCCGRSALTTRMLRSMLSTITASPTSCTASSSRWHPYPGMRCGASTLSA